ncbi:MAG: PHP domain-containing protein [Clostridia bacterium]|nr:PHP domain-containing protein [Clostridia bacterium]
MKYANLHLHSTYSDGVLEPNRLVFIGKSLGYRALALTDHETDGGVRSFMEAARAEGIEAISGTEFYGMHEGFNLHLTALDFDMGDPGIRALITERCEAHYDSTKGRFKLGVERGFIEGICWEDVERYNAPGSWYCAGSLVRAYNVLRIPVPEGLVANVFKSPEAQAFASKTPNAERVIKTVRGAGGVIALAHPYNRTHLIPSLVEMGLNGVEVSHPDNKENTSYLAAEAARTYNLYHCGGTDHTGPMSGMGGKHARPALHGLTEEEFYTLKERKRG